MDNEHHQTGWLRPDASAAALAGLSADGLSDAGVAAPAAASCMTSPDMFFHSSMDGNANHSGYYSSHSRVMPSYRSSPSEYTSILISSGCVTVSILLKT